MTSVVQYSPFHVDYSILVFSIIKECRTTSSQASLNSICFPFFPFIILLSVSLHMLRVCTAMWKMCLSCCGSTWLIYTVILYKWNSFSSFYSLRTSVQKYHVVAWVVTHSPSAPPISSNRSSRSFSPINPYGESIYNWWCTHSSSSMSGATERTPDMAVSHMINGSADLPDPGRAQCVSVCVRHVWDVRCPLGGIGRMGADVFLHGELGVWESGES